jgi:hypothetical protein
MSHCTLIKKFDQVWCKLGFHKCSSQYASHPKCDEIANAATSKTIQLSFIPITTTSLHFKTMIVKHKRYHMAFECNNPEHDNIKMKTTWKKN